MTLDGDHSMTRLLAPLLALFLSLIILLAGHGVQLTMAPLLASKLGWSAETISYTGSAYFFGFVMGCLVVPRLVANVGHIRVFAVLTSAATAAFLALVLLPHPIAWFGARLITGLSMAGLYMVIESWLNDRTTADNRGQILSLYTFLTLAAICLGQLATGLPLSQMNLILIGAILLTLGAIPVGLTRSEAPQPIPMPRFRLREVFGASHVAVVGAFAGGLTTSGYWVLGPVVAQRLSLEDHQIGYFLALAILGGALLQLPAGRLSDRIDRRWVLAGLGLLGTLAAVAGLASGGDANWLYVAMFLYGGTTFPLYSLCLAHANDNTSLGLIEVGSVILLVHSAGAVIGPLITAKALDLSPYGLFVMSGGILLTFSLWSGFRAYANPSQREYFEPFSDAPKTSQEVFEVVEAVADDAEQTPPGDDLESERPAA